MQGLLNTPHSGRHLLPSKEGKGDFECSVPACGHDLWGASDMCGYSPNTASQCWCCVVKAAQAPCKRAREALLCNRKSSLIRLLVLLVFWVSQTLVWRSRETRNLCFSVNHRSSFSYCGSFTCLFTFARNCHQSQYHRKANAENETKHNALELAVELIHREQSVALSSCAYWLRWYLCKPYIWSNVCNHSFFVETHVWTVFFIGIISLSVFYFPDINAFIQNFPNTFWV